MKIGILILFVCSLMPACRGKYNIPRRILSPDKMQSVLWDMVKADQYLKNYSVITDSSAKLKESLNLYQQVFRIHNISKEKFRQSFAYYRIHPNILNIVLDSINNRSYNKPIEFNRPQPENRMPDPKVLPVQ